MRTPAHMALAVMGALFVMVAGCAQPPVDPGPNPAQVVVKVKRVITVPQVQNAMRGYGPLFGRAVRLDTTLGPFWEVTVDQKQADGSWRRLPRAPGQKDMLDGYSLDTERVFLAPPGPQQLRFYLGAFLNRSWEEMAGDPYIYRRQSDGTETREYMPRWISRSEIIYVVDQRAERQMELKNGKKSVISPF